MGTQGERKVSTHGSEYPLRELASLGSMEGDGSQQQSCVDRFSTMVRVLGSSEASVYYRAFTGEDVRIK